MIGKTLSHYRILEEIGEGGMAVVYKARDTKLDRFVAVKLLSQNLCCDVDATERFIQEAKAASALNHQNIGVIHEINQTPDGQTFIVMAHYEAETLKDRLDRGIMEIAEALDIAIQTAAGLNKAHEKGIVHRDIKPSNILVTKDGHVEIIDFGVAKLVRVTDPGEEKVTVGTVSYMSPEQARGEEVDLRTDIWALGVVLYEMLTGRRPFIGDYSQIVFYSIINSETVPVSSLRNDVPLELELIVRKAMSKNPDERYQRLDDMAADLKEVKSGFVSGRPERDVAGEILEPSIAVLPFRDMSAEKDQEYFCEGMAEELINALAKVESLRVVARTSSFQFKDRNEDIRNIGELLHVDTLLEGSVRKKDDRLRITVQLINVNDGYHLWSECYDREMDDIFTLQEEIAVVIVDKLRGKLLGKEKEALSKHYTENVEAYRLYLKGRYFWNKRTAEGLRKAIDCFEQAIAADPGFALAYAGLADAFNLLVFYCILSPKEAIPKAGEAAMKALKLGDATAEAYTSLAFIKMYYDRDWSNAEKRFKQALEHSPDYSTAHHWFAELLIAVGRMDEALTEARYALDSDPLSLIVHTLLGWYYYFSRKYDEAAEYLQKALDMDRDFVPARLFLGLTYAKCSKFEEAIAEFNEGISIFGDSTLMSATIGHAHALAGERKEALRLIDDLEKSSSQKYVPSYYIAAIYADLGEPGRAFEWLEKSYDERDVWFVFLNVDPIWDHLRSDTRFESFINRMGLAKRSATLNRTPRPPGEYGKGGT